MKNFFNILLLTPVLLYVLLLPLNKEILTIEGTINLFWLGNFTIPLIAFISLFFVSYILIIFYISKFSHFFVAHKNKNLIEQINTLKSEMLDREPKIIAAIEEKFGEILEKSQSENKKNIDIIKKENDKVVTSLNYDLKIIKEKIEKFTPEK